MQLRPRRRAVDRAAMRSNRYDVGKLALCREIAGNVLVVSGHCTKFFAGSFVGIEHYDGLARAFLEIVERRNEVGVARYEHDAVEVLFHVVYEHLRCDVHIRTFLFGLPHGRSRNLFAGFAGLYRLNPSMYTMVFFIRVTPKGKSRTFARLCTALPKLSGRLSTHQGVRAYCTKFRRVSQGGRASEKGCVLVRDDHCRRRKG